MFVPRSLRGVGQLPPVHTPGPRLVESPLPRCRPILQEADHALSSQGSPLLWSPVQARLSSQPPPRGTGSPRPGLMTQHLSPTVSFCSQEPCEGSPMPWLPRGAPLSPSLLPQLALGRRRQPPGPGEKTGCLFLAPSLLVPRGVIYRAPGPRPTAPQLCDLRQLSSSLGGGTRGAAPGEEGAAPSRWRFPEVRRLDPAEMPPVQLAAPVPAGLRRGCVCPAFTPPAPSQNGGLASPLSHGPLSCLSCVRAAPSNLGGWVEVRCHLRCREFSCSQL